MQKLNIISLLKETFSEFMEDKAMRLSAALAYYSVFSLAPLLIIAISIAGAVFGEKAAQGAIEGQLSEAIGAESAAAVQEMISGSHASDNSGLMTIVGVMILLVAASGVFSQLKDAMNTVWDIALKPGFNLKLLLKGKLVALSMVLVIGFLLLISLALSTSVAALTDWLGNQLPLPGFLFQIFTFIFSIAIVTLLFAMIFKVLPDAEIEWRDVWSGAFLTAILFSVGKMCLALYLGREAASSAYGAAGALILLLSWVYYSANILLLGAEFTQVYARHRGRAIAPTKNSVKLT